MKISMSLQFINFLPYRAKWCHKYQGQRDDQSTGQETKARWAPFDWKWGGALDVFCQFQQQIAKSSIDILSFS